MIRPLLSLLLVCLAGCGEAPVPAASSERAAEAVREKPLAVLIAGKKSHGDGEHEHNAGVLLFAKALAQSAPQVDVKVHLNEEWPSAEELDRADTILLYCDDGGAVLAKGDRLAQLGKQMGRGAGFIAVHWAVGLSQVKEQALAWLGGFKDPGWSVNPVWTASYRSLPAHPVTQGVKPFTTEDEWYFHMRFNARAGTVTPILTDLPTVAIAEDGCCGYGSNPDVVADVKAGKPQATAWAYERPDGGRAFGFTGGHFHETWGNDEQRKLLLNAILWTAKVEVPAGGAESRLAEGDLVANLEPTADE